MRETPELDKNYELFCQKVEVPRLEKENKKLKEYLWKYFKACKPLDDEEEVREILNDYLDNY